MAVNFYPRKVLIGGTSGALDEIDGAGLNDLDFAIVSVLGKIYMYSLDADSAAAEDSPKVISPDANAGTKRWILQGIDLRGGNTPTDPALSFGDNTGIYEEQDNFLAFAINGVKMFQIDISNNAMRARNDGGALINVNTTSINPSLVPRITDPNTGIGSYGADALSVISGGVEGVRVTEDAGNIEVDVKGNLTAWSIGLVSFENQTVYFEGNAVFN